ncbi:MAG: amidohydrolase family protein [Candidatus Thorarchaeota archaeon]
MKDINFINMAQEKSRLVLKEGDIFDSVKGIVKKNQTIVISDNKIFWCGEDDDFEKEPNDKVIDIEGNIILPGLIDCHVHLDSTAEPDYERKYLRTSKVMWHYYALQNAQRHLINGYTCLRDCGSLPEWAPSLRRIFEIGALAGPRIVIANLPITQWGNQEAIGPMEIIEYYGKLTEVKTGIDGIKHAVRDRKRSGADFIKTITTGGVLHGMTSQVDTSLFLNDELLAMTEEAHRLGMHVACHAHGKAGIYKAVEANVDTIEHGTLIDEETIDLMIKKKTFLIPTQAASFGIINPEISKQLPPEVQKKEKQIQQQMITNHKLAFEKGVLFAIGTDAGTPGNPHGTTTLEIINMIENVGMTTTQALQAATLQASKAIKMDKNLGSIKEGKLADLIVCNGNPIEDIYILKDPKNLLFVIKDGIIMAEKGKITYFN